MGKGFFISNTVGIVGLVLSVAALSTIIALSVVYSQEKAKNNNISPTDGGTTSRPPDITTTPTPSNEPWDKYRLPKSLVPDHYNVTLWPRLAPNLTTGLYIFTGNVCNTHHKYSGATWFSLVLQSCIQLVLGQVWPPWSKRIKISWSLEA